jgi:hypothetical protein
MRKLTAKDKPIVNPVVKNGVDFNKSTKIIISGENIITDYFLNLIDVADNGLLLAGVGKKCVVWDIESKKTKYIRSFRNYNVLAVKWIGNS